MAKYAHSDVLDNGLNEIKTYADEMWLVKGYAAGDSYATAAAKKVCSVAMVSGDYTLSGADAAARVLAVATKSNTASASSTGGDNLHVLLVRTAATKILWATDETTDQVVTSGNTVTFPTFNCTSGQPV